MYQAACDTHTHTIYSRHAYSTIGENVAAAKAAGLELLGSTDHFGDMIYGDYDIRDYQYFANMGCWPREQDGVTVLRGAEVDIIDAEGRLFGQGVPVPFTIVGTRYPNDRDLYCRVTDPLDYVVASVHNAGLMAGRSLAETTRMYTRVLENPRVLILGHTGRAGVPFDLDEVLTCAREKHKLIEINEHSLADRGESISTCRKIAERCAELGVGITLSSDAHIATRIGRFDCSKAMLEQIHFPQELIASRNRTSFLTSMKEASVSDVAASLL